MLCVGFTEQKVSSTVRYRKEGDKLMTRMHISDARLSEGGNERIRKLGD
jgi:hypothetical protein